jgi:plastocyanin
MTMMNRRRFTLFGLGGIASAALVACGNEVGNEQAINPTKIPDVPGAPKPTLADLATPGGEAPAGDGGEAGGGETGGGDVIQLEAIDPFAWSTNDLSAAPGQTIHVVNTGILAHDFSIDEFGGKLVDLPSGGAEGDWVVPADAAPGTTFTYYCSVPGHRESGMEGTLTIVEGGGAAEASPAAEGEASPAAGEQPAGGAPPAAGSEPVQLEAVDPFAWSTHELTASPGQTIHVVNTGILAHDFSIDGIGEKLVDLPSGGAEGDWIVPTDAAPGTVFTFYCSVPGHRESGMEGTLTIA